MAATPSSVEPVHDNTHDEAAEKKIISEDAIEVVNASGSQSANDEKDIFQGEISNPWWAYIWDYDPIRTQEERKFVQKLDFFLLTTLCLAYFCKGLDQANIGAAFISGMKEDLNMYGNQLNLVDTSWTIGYVLGMIPSNIILTKIRPSIWIPSCEIVWTLLTFTLAAAKKSNHVIGIRFLIGFSESIFYPAAHLVLGSWYKPSELGKRAGILYAVGSAAGMFTGYLQIAVYKNLNGVGGLAGWQWLFIMDGVISVPIALIGFWFLPDYPHNTKAFYLNEKDKVFAKARMESVGRAPFTKLGWSVLRRVFGSWHVYVLTALYVVFSNNGSSNSVNPLTLWLKSEHWSVTKLNLLPTGQAGVQLVACLIFAILSDYLQSRPIVMSITSFLGLFTAIVLAIWTIPNGLKWFALFLNRAAVPFGFLSLSWTNEICGGDAEERAIVIAVMNAIGYAFNAWLPLLTYPQKASPKFHNGWRWSIAAFLLQIVLSWVIQFLWKRELKTKAQESESEDVSSPV